MDGGGRESGASATLGEGTENHKIFFGNAGWGRKGEGGAREWRKIFPKNNRCDRGAKIEWGKSFPFLPGLLF